MLAWRRLTLGSGSRSSLPALRPMTTREPSKVSDGASPFLAPLAESTRTVTGISGRGHGAFDPRDHVGGDVALHVLTELLDAGRRGHVHLRELSADDIEADEHEAVLHESWCEVRDHRELFLGDRARLHA